MKFTDSIVALSSGRLPSGVAVIRISGSQTRFAIETIAGALPPARTASLRPLKAADGAVLDSGLVLFFPEPASFTGEDAGEFHVHGGRAVVAAVLNTLTALDGVRHAEPGEFTRRAFLNGKMSLPETEGLADLVNAETEAQRRFALLNAEGAQSELYTAWRRRLIHARAMIEAEIDFADEDDVPGSVASSVWADVEAMIAEIDRHMNGFRAAEIIRDGFDVVIVGAPNAGKSTLFNALAKREAAIVSDEPGTTRDLLEIALDINGLRIRITDTAGLRTDAGKVETIGIERARAKARVADLVVVLEDMHDPLPIGMPVDGLEKVAVGTKLDIAGPHALINRYDLAISVRTGVGVDCLIDEIGRLAEARILDAGDVLPSRLRHVELLKETRTHLSKALNGQVDDELRAEDLRLASDRLGRIIGSVDVEDLLDAIFSQFCIGK